MPQGKAQVPNPESKESDNNPRSDSQSEVWELDNEEESEKEPISYPKPSVEQRCWGAKKWNHHMKVGLISFL